MNLFDRAADIFLPSTSQKRTIPIQILESGSKVGSIKKLTDAQRDWLKATAWTAKAGKFALVANAQGALDRVLFVAGAKNDPFAPFQIGGLYNNLPDGAYHIEADDDPGSIQFLALALAAYRFDVYRDHDTTRDVHIKLPETCDAEELKAVVNAVGFGRDMINTPANDLGPDELEAAARALAKRHKARISVVEGDDLLKKNFPMIHAVGRASTRAPRLVDMNWGGKSGPRISLVGKGVVFDTGGLNIKPGNYMTLMKKDMGGAATTLALADMIMSAKLPVRLRVLVPVAENAVAGNAFRPGDILQSRDGMTVEIGNTDAEGRLILADALSLADEDSPDLLISFATLTGAARVAMGPDVPPLYCTSDEWASDVVAHGMTVCDPLWQIPFWQPYDRFLKSDMADVNHISDTPMAGSITAALFLKRFVKKADAYMHIDMYGWTPVAKPARPKGGEPQAARAVFETLKSKYL